LPTTGVFFIVCHRSLVRPHALLSCGVSPPASGDLQTVLDNRSRLPPLSRKSLRTQPLPPNRQSPPHPRTREFAASITQRCAEKTQATRLSSLCAPLRLCALASNPTAVSLSPQTPDPP
jgi:hypothetical protein